MLHTASPSAVWDGAESEAGAGHELRLTVAVLGGRDRDRTCDPYHVNEDNKEPPESTVNKSKP